MKSIQQYAKNIISIFDKKSLRVCYQLGQHDLKNALPQSLPISDEQKLEILNFWKPYLIKPLARFSWDIRWYNVYNRTNVFGFDLKKYIPDSYYYCMADAQYNISRAAQYIDDKNLYDLYFSDVSRPITICRKERNLFLDAKYQLRDVDTIIKECLNYGKIIIKPSVTASAGEGISVWDSSKNSIDDLRMTLDNGKSLIIQKFLSQSPVLSQFNASTVNTMRIVTLLFQGEIHVVTAVLICGGKDAVTNHLHAGGICCGIHSDGHLFHTAFDGKLNQYKVHPNGAVFADCVIPNYTQCTDMVKKLAPRLCQTSKLISWDVTLDEHNQPVLIEANLRWGGSVQIAAGPIFGDMTEDILKEIAMKK